MEFDILAAAKADSNPVPIRLDDAHVLRVGNTRIEVATIVEAFRAGQTPEQMIEDYSTLLLGDVYSVIAFYLRHTREIDDCLKQEDDLAAKVRVEIESRWSPTGVRERLLARLRSA